MTVCLYHANCMDGFGSAYAAWEKFGDEALYIPVQYGEEAPLDKLKGKLVLIVDFSYKRDEMDAIREVADMVIWIDHHESSKRELVDSGFLEEENVFGRFEMGRSGAALTWEHLHPDTPVPTLINLIEDRDLWKFQLDGSRELHAFLESMPNDFSLWSMIKDDLEHHSLRREIFSKGECVLRWKKAQLQRLLSGPLVREITICGHTVPVANLNGLWASEAGNILSQGKPFAATYYDSSTGRHFSLRSSKGGMNVAQIAEVLGGGGHAAAAGFTMPLGWEGDGED